MRNILAIAEREVKSYFVSPLAYVVTAVFVAIWGFLFAIILVNTREATLRFVLSNISVTLLLSAPLLTMRLLAEEQRTGTMELLLTAPVRDMELVVGKYLGSLVFLLAMLLVTLYFPVLLLLLGNPDRGPMLTGYMGVVLMGGAFLAIGLLASSITSNQIVAAVITFATLLFLWLSDTVATIISGPAGEVFRYISVTRRMEELPRGVIDSRDVIFFLSVIVACLFLTVRSVETRRWR